MKKNSLSISLLLFSAALFYMGLMCATVASNYEDNLLEQKAIEMLSALNLRVTSYISAAISIGNFAYVTFYSYIHSQSWPKLFVVAFIVQSISKVLFAAELSLPSGFLYFRTTDYLILVQLAISYSQCLICLEMLWLDSFRNRLNSWVFFVFIICSCLNMFAVYGKMIGISNAEYCMLPFYMVMYLIAFRWLLLRSGSKAYNGLLVTANIDVMYIIFIFPNMCHLTPRLLLLYANSQSMYLNSTQSWFVSAQFMATTITYFATFIVYRQNNVESQNQQLKEISNSNNGFENLVEVDTVLTLDEEIVLSVAMEKNPDAVGRCASAGLNLN